MKKVICLALCIVLMMGILMFAVPALSTDTGDVNDDADINIDDLVLLAQYLAKWDVEIVDYASDCTGDGIVNVADAVLLAQYLAGWNVYFGTSNPYTYIDDVEIPIVDIFN